MSCADMVHDVTIVLERSAYYTFSVAKRQGRQGRQSVSYTHLDVYKRQYLYTDYVIVNKRNL